MSETQFEQTKKRILQLLSTGNLHSIAMRTGLRALVDLAAMGQGRANDFIYDLWKAPHEITQVVQEVIAEAIQENQAKFEELRTKHQELDTALSEAQESVEKLEIVYFIQESRRDPVWALLTEVEALRDEVEHLTKKDQHKTKELRVGLAQHASRLNQD